MVIFLMMYWLPVYRKNDSIFAIPVSESDYVLLKKRFLRPYRLSVLILLVTNLFLITQLGRLGNERILFLISLFPLLALILLLILYGYFHQKVKPFEKISPAEHISGGAVLNRRFSDFLRLRAELAFWLFLVLGVAFLAKHYPRLPESMPIHWNHRGIVDHFVEKSPWNVAKPLVYVSLMWVFLQLLQLSILHGKNSLPSSNTARFLFLKNKITFNFYRLIDAIKIMLAMIFTGAALLPLAIVRYPDIKIMALFLGFSFLTSFILMVVLIIILLKNSAIHPLLQKEFGTASPAYNQEANYWKWGIFYVNPSDPVLWIERRDGLGWTLNIGHRKSIYWIFGLISTPLLLTSIFT